MLKLLRNIVPICVIAAFLCFPMALFAQLSKVHYIPPISVTTQLGNSEPEDQFIYISTPSVNPITVVIKPVGAARADYIYKTVSNKAPAVENIRLPNGVTSPIGMWDTQLVIPESLGAAILNDKGYIIEAEKPIYVSVRLQSQAQAGAIVSKGGAALSDSFLFGGFVNDVSPIVTEYNSFFSVMAVDDDTDITISFPKSVKLHNYAGTYPVTFKLQKNESYVGVLRATEDTNNTDGLIGGSLVSSKGVVVVSGSSTGTNGEGNGHDYGIDQLVGTEKAGEEFIFIRGEAPNFYNGTENVVLVPLNAGTTYSVNGGAASSITGAYAVIEGDSFNSNKNMYVVTSDPVMAYQGIGGLNPNSGNPEPNQGMFVVPPLSCSAKGGINNIPFINRIGNNSHNGAIGIVAEVGEDVLLNGTVLTNPLSTDNPNYVTYRISNLNQNLYDVNSAGELYVSYYTYSNYASSGGFYSGFQSAPEFNFNLDLVALGACIQNSLVLNATNLSGLDSYRWWYNPSQDAEITQWQEITTNANLSSITPTQVGWYQLRGVYSCGSNTENLNSQAIFIGNCPDDTDNDGVVDNLDLDEDNDGVLDRFESGGDIIPDFTDPNNPLLPSTTNKNISLPPTYGVSASLNTDTNGILSGDNLGNITSQLNASSEAINSYELNFTEPTTVSIVFPQNPNYVENEIITVSTTDSNKTISLINTSGELLVDTNYDFAYESGVQYFTNNRVSVKYSPSATTLNNSEFIASSLTNITITHTLENVTKDGELNFQIKIIDHPIDTDGDNISDHSDLDSDNDSCFDVTEAGFEDADKDGVLGSSPVIFDPSSSTSTADIRGRVVFSGYDSNTQPLDNDNNNIYDFQEAGTPATLSEDFAVSNAVLCEGESLYLSFKSADAENVMWEVDSDLDGVFESADALGTITNNADTYTFEINSVTKALDQAVFQARLSKNTYACTTDTQLFTLTVNDNTTKPNLDPLTVVCKGAAVADLGLTNVVWYNVATGGSPLADNTILAHNNTYFAASVLNGCIGELRSETKVVVNDPEISTVTGITTFCAGETITLSLDTNKILPSPDDFARINDLEYVENAAGPVQYDNGFYYTQKGIKTGVLPITWPTAKALGESIVGATMYVINSTAEEDAVYQGLQHMGLIGNDNIAFWLGLFQDRNAGDYSEPDGGWYWVDGTPLTYQNWRADEPNDYMSAGNNFSGEDYGQFEFGNFGKSWNDMSLTDGSGQSYPLFEYKAQTNIEWYTFKNGAETPIAGIANSSQLEVSPIETTNYFVRVTTNGVVCDSEPFTITINPLPNANIVLDAIEICVDSNNGAITSTELKGSFDLTSKEATILGGQSDTNHTIAYYTTRDGAENETSVAKIQTPSAYMNTSNPQTIYYRVTNTDTNCISNVGELSIVVQVLPYTITIPNVEACDDLDSGSDEDGILLFDLTKQTAAIEALLGSTTQWSISYHETVADAEANNAITEYTTKISDNGTKTIVVRIEDNATACYRTDNTLDLVVLELPKINKSSFLREQCDTDTDGVVQDNLTLYNDIFSTNHQNEIFTYYTDAVHNNQIINPTEFYNTSMNQTVYVKITNSDGCERTFNPATGDPLTIEIRVRTSTIKNTFLETYYACLDPSVKINTGISTFDKVVFADLEATLIAEHPAFVNNNVTIQFFETESDAASKISPIDTSQDYINSTPNSQQIWAAVDANGLTETTCLGLKQVANFVVEPLAILHPVSIPRQCDGDSPKDLDSQDGLFPFDTSTVMSQLLLTQDPANYEITFYDENDAIISTNGFPAEYLSASQPVRVVVENKPSNVTPSCYQEAFFMFTVDDSPKIGNYNLPAVCDNDDGILNGLADFDTSSLNTELLDGQANMEILFLQRDGLGNETIIGNSLPNPFNTETTAVIAQIYNPSNTTCIAEETIIFQVNENPVFDLAENLVFCQNLGFDTIYVTNPSATYTYAWVRNGVPITEQPTQNLIITQGGTYEVTATNTLTGCETSNTIVVDESEFPLFELDDLTVFDLTGDGSNRIEVLTGIGALGIGDYEFSLDGGPYQDNPIFEDVPPGIHQISVRDKNGCGTKSIDASVIGYPLYFTPNGNGKDDNWQVLGVNAVFQSQSLIYIFDRHGRLLAQIATDGPGWDGTYNGTAMPADDYWFSVKLEDGRTFTGHFSLMR